MAYPVAVTVAPQIEKRDVVTALLRFFLVLPHMILVAGPGAFASGLLGSVAAFLAFINWCAIVFTGQSIAGIDEFMLFFLRWHLRASAYAMLLVDPYPPFGDGEYPATLTVERPSSARDRVSVGLRLIFVIPQVIVLAVIGFIWGVTVVIAWFAIIFTAAYPASLYQFGVGALRWIARVNAYVLLVVDDYPPFSFD